MGNPVAIGNSGQPQTTVGHVPFYLTAVAIDQNGHAWTVHNWDEPHQDLKQWRASDGAPIFNTGRFNSYLFEWIAIEPSASFAYVIGFLGNPYTNSARTGMTFAVFKINLSNSTIATIATPYNNVSIPFTNGSTVLDQQVELFALNGLALSGANLYVTDSVGWQILVYNTSTFALSLTISSVTLPNGIAIDGSGNIWVGNNHTQVSVYNSAGVLQGTPITGLTDVWGLSISGNTLYALDQGAHNVKAYTISGTTATLAATYGHQAAAGETSPLGFGQLRSIASDSSGNFIITQFIANEQGSRMVKFNSSGQFVWEQNCFEFVSCATYSQGNTNRLITLQRQTYTIDRTRNTYIWTGSGVTDFGNYFGVSDNAKVLPWVFPGSQYPQGGKSKCLTFFGNDFFYYFPDGINMAVYRVVNTGQIGPALQMCSVLAESRPGADGSYQSVPINWNWLWSWYDSSGQGLTSVDTTTNLSSAPSTTINEAPINAGAWTWYSACACVDQQGTIWLASYQRKFGGITTYSEIWAVPLHGFSQSGNPIYLWNDAVKILTTPKLMADAGITGSVTANYMVSLDHDADTGRLYIGLANPNGTGGGSAQDYNAFICYSGVDNSNLGLITRPPEYLLNLAVLGCGIAVLPGGSGHVAIGTRFGYNGTATVSHLDRSGNEINRYQPTPDFISVPGEPSGIFDNVGGLNAELAPDDTIDIFAEEDYNGRVFWYSKIQNYRVPKQGGSGTGGHRGRKGRGAVLGTDQRLLHHGY